MAAAIAFSTSPRPTRETVPAISPLLGDLIFSGSAPAGSPATKHLLFIKLRSDDPVANEIENVEISNIAPGLGGVGGDERFAQNEWHHFLVPAAMRAQLSRQRFEVM